MCSVSNIVHEVLHVLTASCIVLKCRVKTRLILQLRDSTAVWVRCFGAVHLVGSLPSAELLPTAPAPTVSPAPLVSAPAMLQPQLFRSHFNLPWAADYAPPALWFWRWCHVIWWPLLFSSHFIRKWNFHNWYIGGNQGLFQLQAMVFSSQHI